MKTGFIHGYPNKPTKKGYSYHGVDRDCLIQPDPGPFEEYPTGPPLGEWEIFAQGNLVGVGWQNKYIGGLDLKPSTDPDICASKWPDGMRRYYFMEITLHRSAPWGGMYLIHSDGVNCNYWFFGGSYNYIYKAVFCQAWRGFQYYWQVMNTKLPSYFTLWRSKDGEFPGFYPVPQKLIYY